MMSNSHYSKSLLSVSYLLLPEEPEDPEETRPPDEPDEPDENEEPEDPEEPEENDDDDEDLLTPGELTEPEEKPELTLEDLLDGTLYVEDEEDDELEGLVVTAELRTDELLAPGVATELPVPEFLWTLWVELAGEDEVVPVLVLLYTGLVLNLGFV
jgi:hypothetical protein